MITLVHLLLYNFAVLKDSQIWGDFGSASLRPLLTLFLTIVQMDCTVFPIKKPWRRPLAHHACVPGPDGRHRLHCVRRLDPVQLDSVASALAKALALSSEKPSISIARYSVGKGLLQWHVQRVGEGDEAQALQELAAVALVGEEVLALTET